MNPARDQTDQMDAEPRRAEMERQDWISIDEDSDRDRLRESGRRLQLCYPLRYDIRITRSGHDAPYTLAVRHRD